MATRAYVEQLPVDSKGSNVQGAIIVKWTGMLNGDDGAPYVAPHRADKSIHSYGTPGAGASLLIEGSNEQVYAADGTALTAPNYQTLNDPQGNPLSFTAAKIEEVLENTNAIRPRVAAGDGTTNWSVTMVISSPARL